MASTSDRIRRVLSDGAPAPTLPRPRPALREVLPAEEPQRAERTLDPELRRRLEALGVAVASERSLRDQRRRIALYEPGKPLPQLPGLEPPAVAAGAPPWPAPEAAWDADGGVVSIEDLVSGRIRETPCGPFLQVERRIPLDAHHGRIALSDALRRRVPLRPRERGPGAGALLDPSEAAFIDTETSGLAGGTGTVAFLVGAGWIDGDAFLVRQYFMRDYPEEGALLHALDEDLAGRPLVSFNGRSFDWPLLTTRWRMNRQRAPARAHLDLLPSARRLWGSTLPSHSLATLERHVIGLERGEDLSGAFIPPAWFEFLRSGNGGTLAQAFRHNEIDVVSMLALFARMAEILEDPAAGVTSPGDRLGTARLLLDYEDVDGAKRCLEAGLSETELMDARPLHRMLGHLCRRAGDFASARGHFEAVAAGPLFDAEAYEQVAKIFEHRVKDFAAALGWTTRALAQTPPGSSQHAAFVHRAERLERRIARARERGRAGRDS